MKDEILELWERAVDEGRLSQEYVDLLVEDAQRRAVNHRVLGKETHVSIMLPNGFTVSGRSACVDPAQYDERIGERVALARVKDQVWAFEGYRLQQIIFERELR